MKNLVNAVIEAKRLHESVMPGWAVNLNAVAHTFGVEAKDIRRALAIEDDDLTYSGGE